MGGGGGAAFLDYFRLSLLFRPISKSCCLGFATDGAGHLSNGIQQRLLSEDRLGSEAAWIDYNCFRSECSLKGIGIDRRALSCMILSIVHGALRTMLLYSPKGI